MRNIHCAMDDKTAYAIATAWLPALQGRVKLLLCPDTYTVVEQYDCVQLDFVGSRFLGVPPIENAVHVAKCLRFSAIVWRRLSQCGGYQVNQHPVFWKTVFSDLSGVGASSSGASSYYTPITDIPRFFTSCSEVFPCFRFRVGAAKPASFWGDAESLPNENIEAIVREFCGGLSSSSLSAKEDDLEEVVFRDTMATLDRYVSRDGGELIELVLSVQGVDTSTMETLKGICDREVAQVKCRLVPEAILSSVMSFGLHAQDLQTLAGVGESSGRQSLPVRVPYVPRCQRDDQFHALMSVLPYSTRFESVQVNAAFGNITPFAPVDWAWLGFAMFHPAATTSRWRKLTLLIDGTEDDAAARASMAKGNNLHHADDNSDNLSSAYYFVVLNEDVVVHSDPETTLPVGSLVDIYGATSCDLDALGDPVRVIVPGIGLWAIEKRKIDRIESLPPSSGAQLTHLSCGYQVSPVFRHSLLPHFTTCLAFLELLNCGNFEVNEVSQLLLSCSNLQSLAITHDGSVWRDSTPDQLSRMARLKSLSLKLDVDQLEYVAPSRLAFSTVLCKLEELRIVSTRECLLEVPDASGSSVFDRSLDTIRYLLLNHRRLQYFHWLSESKQDTTVREPYRVSRQKQIARLGATDDQLYRIVHIPRPLSVASRVAFISVVQRVVQSLLNRGLLERIFEFACGVYQRELSIQT